MSMTCTEVYGFLPCSTSPGGSAFLVALWGYTLNRGAALLSGFVPSAVQRDVGEALIPILQAVPAAVLVAIAGGAHFHNFHLAPLHVFVGVGLVTGQAVLMAAAWGASVLLGRVRMDSLQGPQAPGGFFTDLFSAGIEVSQDLGAQALKMLLTTLLPLALLGCALLRLQLESAVLGIVGIGCLALLLWLTVWQVLHPRRQRKAHLEQCIRHMRYNTVRSMAYYCSRWGGLLQGSTLNEVALDHLFLRFDKDKDGMLSLLELSRLVEALELSPHTPTPAPLPLSSQALDAQGAGTSSSGGATGPRSSIEPLARSPSMQFAVAAAEAQGGGEGEGSQGGSGGAGSGTGPGAAEKALAPYAHLRHLVDYMADCMDASPAGVSQEAFVEVIKMWAREKMDRFLQDFPDAAPPKAVQKQGNTLFWTLVGRAPDDYHSPLLQLQAHKRRHAQLLAQQQAQAAEVQAGAGAAVVGRSNSGRAVGGAVFAAVAAAVRSARTSISGGGGGALQEPLLKPEEGAAARAASGDGACVLTVAGASDEVSAASAPGTGAPSVGQIKALTLPEEAMLDEMNDWAASSTSGSAGGITGVAGGSGGAAAGGVLQLVAGITICAFFSLPFISACSHLSLALSVRPSLVACIAAPMALRFADLAAMIRAARARRTTAALASCYRILTTGNTLVLGVLSAVLAARRQRHGHRAWQSSPELAAMVLPLLYIGIVGSLSRTITGAQGLLAVLLAPAMLALVFMSDNSIPTGSPPDAPPAPPPS